MDEYKYILNLFKKYEHKHHPIHKNIILFTNGEVIKEYNQTQKYNIWNEKQYCLNLHIGYTLLKQTKKAQTFNKKIIRISLYTQVNSKTYTTAQLLAETFLKYKNKKGLVIDHIDNNSLNNNVSNLQIITHRLNCRKDSNLKYRKQVSWKELYQNKKLNVYGNIIDETSTNYQINSTLQNFNNIDKIKYEHKILCRNKTRNLRIRNKNL